MKLQDLRENYGKGGLIENQMPDNPIELFEQWMQDAVNSKIKDANSMVLSTLSEKGVLQSRVVLLKDIIEGGFVFYTNYESAKAREMEHHTAVALNFFWVEAERQVRVSGTVSKTSTEISDAYFSSRPRGSQIGAWVSPQSKMIGSRGDLDESLAFYEKKFENETAVPRPPHWGGFIVQPHSIEFWQGRPNRLHDRICYVVEDETWARKRLAP